MFFLFLSLTEIDLKSRLLKLKFWFSFPPTLFPVLQFLFLSFFFLSDLITTEMFFFIVITEFGCVAISFSFSSFQ